MINKKQQEEEEGDAVYVYVPKPKHFRATFPKSSLHSGLPELKLNKPSAPNKNKLKLNFRNIIDSETGETISLTNARWNCKEGRVNMDSKAIIATGTGKLLISANHSPSSDRKARNSTVSISGNELVSRYLNTGPINNMYNINWDAKSNRLLDEENSPPKLISSSTTIENDDDSVSTELQDTNNISISTSRNILLSEDSPLRDQTKWKYLQTKIFNDLFDMASKLERNKFLTNEKKLKGGLEEVQSNCRTLAKLKVRYLRDLMQAVHDEAEKEEKRKEIELNSADNPKKLKAIKKTHDAEREKAKIYIETMQNDSEVVFIRRLSELGYLW